MAVKCEKTVFRIRDNTLYCINSSTERTRTCLLHYEITNNDVMTLKTLTCNIQVR